MQEIIDGSSLERLAVRYTDDELRAAIVALLVDRELLLRNERTYDEDIEDIRIKIEVSMYIEDELGAGGLLDPEMDRHIRQYYLPRLIDFVRGFKLAPNDEVCALFHLTREELLEGTADAIRMLNEKVPDIALTSNDTPPDN